MDRGNLNVKAKLKALGNIFANKSEISAQEAAYGVLGLELSRFSREHIFINTGPPEQRDIMTKSKKELEKLNPEDKNIALSGLLTHYEMRSDKLENVCLADYASCYQFCGKDSPGNGNVFTQIDAVGHVRLRTKAKVIRFRRYGEKQDYSNYAREQVMLYLPWRDESKEILTNPCQVYLENKYILERARVYNAFIGTNVDMEDLINELSDNEDKEVVCCQSENYGVGPTDVSIFPESGQDNTIRERFPLPNLIPELEYQRLYESLNNKQRDYVLHVIHSIKSGRQILEYLSGGAGVGKSTTIKAIVQALIRHHNSTPEVNLNELVVLLCAPTGVAAFNIGGATLHSTFILPFNQSAKGKYGDTDLTPLSENIRTEISSKLIGIKLFICDEVSMTGNVMLNHVNIRMQEIFRSNVQFGGKSVIFVGDLWQLPPIGSGYIFAPIKESISALDGTTLWDSIKFYELTEIMRQSGDPAFATALTNMATGVMTTDDISLFKSQEISEVNIPLEGITWLFFRRKDVKEHNDLALASMPTNGWQSKAFDTVEGLGALSEASRQNLLSRACLLDYQDAQGLPYHLLLKLGIKYMVTMNLPQGDGLTNGAVGILRHVEQDSSDSSSSFHPSRIWLEFSEKRVGIKTRNEYVGPRQDPNWTPFHQVVKPIVKWDGRNVRVMRKQFPLTPAEAITIHKSQSQTFERMVLSVHKSISRSLLYVGCSRARSAEGFWINGEFVPPKKVNVDDPVRLAYEALRKRPVKLCHLPSSPSHFSIYFHNIEHIRPNFQELKKAMSTIRPTIVCLVETYTLFGQDWSLDGYEAISRSDHCPSKKDGGYGTLCFALQPTKYLGIWRNCTAGAHVELTAMRFREETIIFGYKSPKAAFGMFEECFNQLTSAVYLDPSRTIIVGDFNMDLNSSNAALRCKMISLGLKSCLPPTCSTTRSGTQIDCVFSSIYDVECTISEFFASHHSPIIIQWSFRAESEVDDLLTESTRNLSINEALDPMDTMPLYPAGLINLPGANICYANAAFQCLCSANLGLGRRQGGLALLTRYQEIMGSLENQVSVCDLSNFLAELRLQYPEFILNQQHNAVELLEAVFNFFESKYIGSVSSMVQMSTNIVDTCTCCAHWQEQGDQPWILRLPLCSDASVEDLILNCQVRTLTEQRTCPACAQTCQFESQLFFSDLPFVLLIQLGRFLENGKKSGCWIFVPQELTILDHVYDLVAVLSHHGYRSAGHYTAECKRDETWYLFDDSQVTYLATPPIASQNSYMLIYSRKA